MHFCPEARKGREGDSGGKSKKESSIIGLLPPPLPLTHEKAKGWVAVEWVSARACVHTPSSFKANICPPPPTLTNTDVKQQIDMLEYWLLCASRPSCMKIDYFKSFSCPECVWKKPTTGSYLFFPPPNIPISVSSGTETRCFKQRAGSCSTVHRWGRAQSLLRPLFSELHQTKKLHRYSLHCKASLEGFGHQHNPECDNELWWQYKYH